MEDETVIERKDKIPNKQQKQLTNSWNKPNTHSHTYAHLQITESEKKKNKQIYDVKHI